MQEVLLLKCGELVLKGLNRSRFEERLMKIVRTRLRPLGELLKNFFSRSMLSVKWGGKVMPNFCQQRGGNIVYWQKVLNVLNVIS